MAIVYTTGTINQPDAGSVGLAMVERIRDDVVAHVAWELADEFTASGGAVRWYVLRCLAAESGFPTDFFVVIGRRLSDGLLYFSICEGYSSASKTMSFFPHGGTSTVVAYDADGRSPLTYVLGTATWPSGYPNPRYVFWTPSGTSTKWWITVSEDGFTVAFNGPSNGFVHVGAYTPLTALPIAMPLQVVGNSGTDGGITRNPAVASQSVAAYALGIEGGGGSNAGSAGPLLGFMGDLRYNDKLQNNQRPVGEQGINMVTWPGVTDFMQSYGWALGKQKRWRVTNKTTPTGFAFGDAYALGGRLWVPFLPTDGRMWDTGVASS